MNAKLSEDETFMQHDAVFDAANHIFRERQKVRGDLWTESSMQKQLEMAEEKLKRVRKNLHGIEEPIDKAVLIDDSLDCINFCAFIIRLSLGLVPDGGIRPVRSE